MGKSGISWRRDVFAKLIDRLNHPTSVIAFDIFFSEEDKQNPKKILKFNIENNEVIDSDQSLLESINGSNVVLAVLGMYQLITKIINQNQKQILFLVEWMLRIMFIVLKNGFFTRKI